MITVNAELELSDIFYLLHMTQIKVAPTIPRGVVVVSPDTAEQLQKYLNIQMEDNHEGNDRGDVDPSRGTEVVPVQGLEGDTDDRRGSESGGQGNLSAGGEDFIGERRHAGGAGRNDMAG